MTEQGESFIRDARDLYLQYENLLKKHCGIEKKRFSVSALYYAFARKAFVQIVKEFSDSGYDFAFCEKKALDELVPYHFVTFDTDDVKSFFTEEVISRYGLDKTIIVADRATELNLLEQLNGVHMDNVSLTYIDAIRRIMF